MTTAPAERAISPVLSVDPSSTTRISCQRPAADTPRTTSPTAAASFRAGMMTEVTSGAATDSPAERVSKRPYLLIRCAANVECGALPPRMTIQRIAVCEAQVPFVQGGAEYHVRALVDHL